MASILDPNKKEKAVLWVGSSVGRAAPKVFGVGPGFESPQECFTVWVGSSVGRAVPF